MKKEIRMESMGQFSKIVIQMNGEEKMQSPTTKLCFGRTDPVANRAIIESNDRRFAARSAS